VLIERTESEVLSLAASRELSENSRLGFASKVTAQQPGLLFVNLQSTSGMHVSLPETRIGSRIQTWNRYAYVTNDPCDQVDSLGLFSSSCQFNVAVNNQVGLSAGQISGIENRINSIFGATTGTNGESVGVKWGAGGTADATLTLTNMSPAMSLYFRIMTGPGTVYGAQSWLLSPRVYVNNIPGGATDAIGGVGALGERSHS
jgi:hypothetical protein